MEKIDKPDTYWKSKLTPEEYRITREKGTERAFTGKYYTFDEEGLYKCVCCGNKLFSSDGKYDSGSGWPSFFTPISKENVAYELDKSLGMVRAEVKCAKCEAHLGHVFNDGPVPTGQRYCVNSASLKFEKKEG